MEVCVARVQALALAVQVRSVDWWMVVVAPSSRVFVKVVIVVRAVVAKGLVLTQVAAAQCAGTPLPIPSGIGPPYLWLTVPHKGIPRVAGCPTLVEIAQQGIAMLPTGTASSRYL